MEQAFAFRGRGPNTGTRLGAAGSDPEMWRDIFLANSSQIQKLTSNFISELKEFSRNLNKGNSHNLLTKLKKTKNVRDKIVKARQAGKFIPND